MHYLVGFALNMKLLRPGPFYIHISVFQFGAMPRGRQGLSRTTNGWIYDDLLFTGGSPHWGKKDMMGPLTPEISKINPGLLAHFDIEDVIV